MKRITEKPTTIYALIKDQEAYVGRTTSPNLSPICYSHCRGEHQTTKGHFDLDTNRPDLIILERLTVPSPIAYRHQIAWIYRLWQAGYVMLGSDETLERAKELNPYTQTIYDQISAEPLENVLTRGRCDRYADADVAPSDVPEAKAEEIPGAASEMLCVRLSPVEKERFDRYAETLGMTRRDMIQYLITQNRSLKHMELDTNLLEVRQTHGRKREQLNRQISELREDLSKARSSKTEIQRRHTGERRLVQDALRTYLDRFAPTSRIPLTIEQGYYKDYMSQTQVAYAYPSGEGHAVMRPAAVLLGTNNAHFVVGTTDQGEEIKLRYYPGSYLGISPANERFSLRGSHWLVAWRQAEDDVMQMVLALPVDIKPGNH